MRRLLTPAWLVRHGLAAGLVVAFLGLGWWQIGRAAGGNGLSWAYAIEWPVFAGFVVFLWWREVRRESRPDAAVEPPAGRRQGPAEGIRRPVVTARRTGQTPPGYGDSALDEYNDYLAWLNANPGARPVDYPGPRPATTKEE